MTDELEPIEETTEETTKELHVEGDKVTVTDAPDGTRTIEATDEPDDEPDPKPAFPR